MLNVNTIALTALAFSFAFSTGALAQGVAKNDHTFGKEKIAKPELDASRKPAKRLRYQAHFAGVDAGFAAAKETCDRGARDARLHCVDLAKVRFEK